MLKIIIFCLALNYYLVNASNHKSIFINEYIGNNSNWYDNNNWSLKYLPNANNIALIINKTVILEFKNNTLYTIFDLIVINSKFIINNNMNITNFYTNNNGNVIINNCVVNVWTNDNVNTITNSGNMTLNNSAFVPNGDLIIDGHMIIFGKSAIATNLQNNGILELKLRSNLDMAYFNFVQTSNATLILYGVSNEHLNEQSYIFICSNVSMFGTLQVNYGYDIKSQVELYIVIPTFNNIANSVVNYDIKEIKSERYNVKINSSKFMLIIDLMNKKN